MIREIGVPISLGIDVPIFLKDVPISYEINIKG